MHAPKVFLSSRFAVLMTAWLAASASCGGKRQPDQDGELLDGSTPDDPDALASLCFPGPFRCEGTRAIPCEPGAAQAAKDCADSDQVCSPSLGCVECVPGQGSCQDGSATFCRNDGTWARFECDAVQGLRCEPSGCLGACALNEVQDSYIGCDYYPTVTLNPVWSGFSFAVAVSNTAAAPTNVTITRGDQVIAEVPVEGNVLRTFELPWVDELKGGDVACTIPPAPGATRLVKQGAYRVRSDRPVTVYQFSPLHYEQDVSTPGCPVIDPSIGQCVPEGQTPPPNSHCFSYSNDASLLLPANALTGSYTALAWPSQSVQGVVTGSGFVAVTATEDGTTVQLHGRSSIAPGAGLPGSGSGSVTMDRGDVLQLVSANDADISGTRVRADKPVQVIAGQSCAYVPTVGVDNCDHIEEALFPEEALGSKYVVAMPVLPTADGIQAAPFVLRVSAIMDGTEVQFEPAVRDTLRLAAGEFADIELDQASARSVLASSNKAIQIATYMVGQAALPGGGVIGDPSMSLAVPVEQFRESYLFTASTTYSVNFAAVIAKKGSAVRIDGELIPDSDYAPVGTSEYGVAQVPLSADSSVHRLEADQEVGLTVYGYGWYTSYMYPGGADLDRITTPVVL